MTNNLNNLGTLYENMKAEHWVITSFIFNYKNTDYIVLIKRFINPIKRKNTYALVQLKFIEASNLKNTLKVEANRSGLIISNNVLRRYFNIDNTFNNYNIFTQFTQILNKAIPLSTSIPKDPIQKQALITSLSKNDAQDPRKIYCIGIRHNPRGSERSVFNTNKTRILRPALFKILGADKSISFLYSRHKSKENDDATILSMA